MKEIKEQMKEADRSIIYRTDYEGMKSFHNELIKT
ncbi:hypothetical protein LCGC14_3114830, partial [marine sediment metagenome]